MTDPVSELSHQKGTDDIQLPSLSIHNLPSELIHQIFSYLPPISIYALSLTCSRIKEHCDVDRLWASQVSRLNLSTPSPYPSYRILYNALAPQLFLPRKIFIGDRHPFGFVVASLYNPNTGNIEIYPVIEDKRSSPDYMFVVVPWSRDPRVFIYDCNPRVRLWEEAEVKISPFSRQSRSGEIPQARSKRDVFATYFPAHATLESDVQKLKAEKSDDSDKSFWPPAIIPSTERVRIRRPTIHHTHNYFVPQPEVGVGFSNIFRRVINAVSEFQSDMNDEDSDISSDQSATPRNVWAIEDTSVSGYVSQKAFKMRKWTKFDNHRSQVETYFELDEALWTPTPDFPLRGIWIATATQPQRLEAIKLTGDPNVPRGKHTFIVNDLTPSSAIRTAPESEVEWPGASVFAGQGQIALDQFRHSSFINIEVIIPATASFSSSPAISQYKTASPSIQTFVDSSDTASDEGQFRDDSDADNEVGASANDQKANGSVPASWIKQEVAIYWKDIGGGIRKYKRVDVGQFFDNWISSVQR